MRAFAVSLIVAAALAATHCAPAASRTSGSPSTPAPSSPPAASPNASGARAPGDPAGSLRDRWLEMFARGYFPGRSGQVFVVPREGEVITESDPLYRFMHGSPWDYDTHIPILFYGQPFIVKGERKERVSQQDIAPTLGAIIGAAPAQTYTGRPQSQVIAAGAGRPRIAMIMVLDAMRADYFAKHADIMPTLSRMRREGAWFADGRATSLPTVTGVGHATIGTGTDPRFHGITVNNIYSRITQKIQPAYDQLDPRELMALTLADIWNLDTDGKAIIIGHGGAIRATAGLVGRGACLVNGRKVLAASYATRDGGWETNSTCYTMPDALKAFNGSAVWKAAGGTWMGHDISDGSKFRASSLFQRFEAEALLGVMEQAAIGADDITDLVMVNMKGPDYTAHAYGPASAEQRETLAELDRQMANILAMLEKKAGPGRSVVAVTADHGMPDEPKPGHRHDPDDVAKLVDAKFGKGVVQYYSDAANSQLYLDTARLKTLGFSLRDVAAFLETQEFYAAAFTEDEVRAAQLRLPSIR